MDRQPATNLMADDSPPPLDGSPLSASNDPSPGDPSLDDPASGEPFHLPMTDVFDLHSVPPRDAEAVVEEYLQECYRLGLTEIRVVHGRGIGVQRAMVRKVLERTEFVAWFGDAPLDAGGWGATVITLRKRHSP
jgi:hypothetical protein